MTQLSLILRNEAYYSLEKLSEKRRAVFEVIQNNPNITNLEICAKLGWQINRVTGRVKELCDLGYVQDSGSKPNPESGKLNTTWKVK